MECAGEVGEWTSSLLLGGMDAAVGAVSPCPAGHTFVVAGRHPSALRAAFQVVPATQSSHRASVVVVSGTKPFPGWQLDTDTRAHC